jgi:hypothetical protein
MYFFTPISSSFSNRNLKAYMFSSFDDGSMMPVFKLIRYRLVTTFKFVDDISHRSTFGELQRKRHMFPLNLSIEQSVSNSINQHKNFKSSLSTYNALSSMLVNYLESLASSHPSRREIRLFTHFGSLSVVKMILYSTCNCSTSISEIFRIIFSS